MTRTITFTIGWGALALLALAVVAIATAFSLTRTVGPPAPDTVTVSRRLDLITVGLNYRF